MRVLYKWINCFRFNNINKNDNIAFFIEIPKEEIDEKIYNLLLNYCNNEGKIETEIVKNEIESIRDGSYFYNVNNADKKLTNKDCIYILIDKNISKAILCEWFYPYSGQWGGYCPFEKLYEIERKTLDDYKNYGIIINNLDEINNIDKLIDIKINT